MGNGNNMGSGGGDDDYGEPASMFMRSDVGLGMMNIMQQNTLPSYTYYHHQDSTQFPLKPISGSENGGLMVGSGKVLFTETQWQELERQTIIYKYIMASMPVPHHLLMPLSTHSNKGGMDTRFASGLDPDLWRCRRTDGKKWRCSRDVAPDQKYCEHHVHKSRPRSRKPVEIQSHNTNVTTSVLDITPTTYTNTLGATSSYQHPRCTEWLMKSGTLPVSSSSNQQLQQSMNSHSPRVGSKRTHIFRQDSEGNLQNDSHLHYNNSSVASDASAGARRQSFIDAWSRSGGGDNCSLTLSTQCSSRIDNDDDHSYDHRGDGMLDMDRGDGLKSHNMWLNQGSWLGSPPGGPLGEALGLGIASSAKGPMDMPSRHGRSDNDDSHGHELR